jgi:hypothetical protein
MFAGSVSVANLSAADSVLLSGDAIISRRSARMGGLRNRTAFHHNPRAGGDRILGGRAGLITVALFGLSSRFGGPAAALAVLAAGQPWGSPV